MAAARAHGAVTPERWREIKAVLAQAMELPVADRTAFVARAATGDDELRREVDSLLAASDGADSLPTARAAIASAAEQSVLESALGQQYEIVRLLGRGGMGAVYLARERALERFVAIKVLRPDLADAPDARERFRREARIAAQLSHPGILPLHTFGEVAGLWYFVMAYVRGVSLAERLRVEGRLPQEEAVRILVELSDALECAHREGVIHRDIKPANVLLDGATGHAMLADFGVSKVQGMGDALTITGMVVGTPNYMSPEQALGLPDVDERSDVYSLGGVAYTMLSGREPFAGVAPEELVHWRVSHDPVPLSMVAPHLPRQLSEVVMKALARDRKARWAHASELKQALVRASAAGGMVLPDPLRDLPTFGPYALIWAVSWVVAAMRDGASPVDRALLVLVALVVPLGFVLHIMNVGRHGLRTSELARVAFWPPEWWGMWWPTLLRRPNDLWPRLPAPARVSRMALSLFLIAVPGMILLRRPFETETGDLSRSFFVTELSLLGGTALVLAACGVWARARGLAMADVMRVLFGATMPSEGWTSTGVARLLRPAKGGVRAPERDSAGDHLRAIEEVAADLPAIGPHAVATARRLVADSEQFTRDIEALAHVASPGEVDRLAAQLSTLGAVSHGELHGLVGRQLEVVRQMRDQIEGLSQERARRLTFLHGLWTNLREMHADGASGAAATSVAPERLRALIAEIEAWS
ncbi:MAG: serine/threonine-protein kinase [Gemmatimonadaceae bacterium]